MRTTLYGTFRTNIRDNMTMKKISPTKSWKNVTTCRSSQKPISTTNSLPVICSCATTGMITELYSGRLKRPLGGVKSPTRINRETMKRKSVYKIILRVLLFCLVWRLSCTAGAITAVMAILYFVPPVSCSISAFQPFMC